MKLFVLLSRVPYPLEKGDKLRAFHHLRCLSKYYDIHLFCLNDTKLHPQAIEKLSLYCKSITIAHLGKKDIYAGLFSALFSGIPFQSGYFFNKKIKKQILAKIQEINPDHIFCQLIRVTEYVKELNIPKTLDYQDVFSTGYQRLSTKSSFFMKPLLRIESKRVDKYEKYIFDKFDNKLIISQPDRDAITHAQKNEIHVIPNGVDTEYFKPVDLNKEFDILFTGNMNYKPNVDGVEYLVKNVLPLLKKKLPAVKILIAGADPHKRVLKLASDDVTVSGWVEDMRDCYAKSRIFVAPMQIGTGLQNKLLEAMAMKLPCVTSGLANNALQATEDSEILVGYSPEDYADKIVMLLKDREVYNRIANGGYNFILKNYDWETQAERIHGLISGEANMKV
ncbi:MAG TPA: glycosyltransferase [Bacteroidales bacterium]|mgnify:CR=1 FL=1|nr:glycosyltransferase [Bacteroidales bacterium]